ncbi:MULTISPECIES: hypothetical protein [unclassified Microbacterium]|uniref:hypothetical protein n=1 Tax=unclassified Microbacterium TaxID=2609290 RepID=UPI00109D6F41|nr:MULTISPECIES: hypothetical protein [unclassified Microbacterium]
MTDETSNPWAEIVGPCYTVASMARTLGWTEAEVLAAGESLRLLMLRTSDDVTLFPSFQLIEGKVVEGLTEVLRVLETGTANRWTWAQWLNTELPNEDPSRNIQYLYAGRLDEALRDAEHDAWAWRS